MRMTCLRVMLKFLIGLIGCNVTAELQRKSYVLAEIDRDFEVETYHSKSLISCVHHCSLSATGGCAGVSYNRTTKDCSMHSNCVRPGSTRNPPAYFLSTELQPTSRSDLAVGKVASASSVYVANWSGTLDPTRAVDGITDYPQGEDKNPFRYCSLPREQDENPWFLIDLQRQHCIWGVIVVYTKDFSPSSSNILKVTAVDETGQFGYVERQCAHTHGEISLNWQHIDCEQPTSGRHVLITPQWIGGPESSFCLLELEVKGY